MEGLWSYLKKLRNEVRGKKIRPLPDLCLSSLHRVHANLFCIVPMLSDVPEGTSFAWELYYLTSLSSIITYNMGLAVGETLDPSTHFIQSQTWHQSLPTITSLLLWKWELHESDAFGQKAKKHVYFVGKLQWSFLKSFKITATSSLILKKHPTPSFYLNTLQLHPILVINIRHC